VCGLPQNPSFSLDPPTPLLTNGKSLVIKTTQAKHFHEVKYFSAILMILTKSQFKEELDPLLPLVIIAVLLIVASIRCVTVETRYEIFQIISKKERNKREKKT
jgi:hypothetical protein